MGSEAFYYLDIDHENDVVTLGFLQERLIVHNLDELRILVDVTGQLNLCLNKLLQSGLQDDSLDADSQAIDLTEITSQI